MFGLNESPKYSPKPDFHAKNVMIRVWWLKGGIIHYIFLVILKGKTITAESYSQE